MRRRPRFLALIIVPALTLASCGGVDQRLAEIGIRRARLLSIRDDHGGFHGDGLTVLQAVLPGGASERERLRTLPGWQSGPLPQGLATRLFGESEGSTHTSLGGLFGETGLSAKAFKEVVSGSFFYFCDNQVSGIDRHDAGAFLASNQPSANIVLCVVDFSGLQCWYFKLDT